MGCLPVVSGIFACVKILAVDSGCLTAVWPVGLFAEQPRFVVYFLQKEQPNKNRLGKDKMLAGAGADMVLWTQLYKL